MSASQLSVYNLALQHLGGGERVSSLVENSKAQVQLTTAYDTMRRLCLRRRWWSFARTYLPLALTTTKVPPNRWLYEYQYPNDCVFARFIVRSSLATKPVPYQIASLTQGTHVIHTNEADAVLCYTRDVKDPNMFSVDFTEALALFLAYQVCVPLTGDVKHRATLRGEAEDALRRASGIDSAEQEEPKEHEVDWLAARA